LWVGTSLIDTFFLRFFVCLLFSIAKFKTIL
jgi:hypothetical protein